MTTDQQPAQDAGRIIEVDTSKLTPIPESAAAPTAQDAGQGTWRQHRGDCLWDGPTVLVCAPNCPEAIRVAGLAATIKRLEEVAKEFCYEWGPFNNWECEHGFPLDECPNQCDDRARLERFNAAMGLTHPKDEQETRR